MTRELSNEGTSSDTKCIDDHIKTLICQMILRFLCLTFRRVHTIGDCSWISKGRTDSRQRLSMASVQSASTHLPRNVHETINWSSTGATTNSGTAASLPTTAFSGRQSVGVAGVATMLHPSYISHSGSIAMAGADIGDIPAAMTAFDIGHASARYPCDYCQRPWTQPLVTPCEHIFCTNCVLGRMKDIGSHVPSINGTGLTLTAPCPAAGCNKPIRSDSLRSLGEYDAVKFQQFMEAKCVCPVCGEATTYGLLDMHQQTKHEMVACQFCHSHFDRSQMGLHEASCLDATVQCRATDQSIGCMNYIKRREFVAHQEHDCLQRLVPCQFADIGCDIRLPSSHKYDHEAKAGNLHLRLMALALATDRKDKIELQNEVKYLKDMVAILVAKVDMLKPSLPQPSQHHHIPLPRAEHKTMHLANGASLAATHSAANVAAAAHSVIPANVAAATHSVIPAKVAAIKSITTSAKMVGSILSTTDSGVVANIADGASTVPILPNSLPLATGRIDATGRIGPVQFPPATNSGTSGVPTVTASSKTSAGPTSTGSTSGVTELTGNEFYLFGGVQANGGDRTAIANTQYLAANNEWKELPSMLTARGWCSASKLEDYFVVTGGSVVGGSRLTTVEAFDYKARTWHKWPNLKRSRDEHSTVTALMRSASGKVNPTVFVIGGVPTGVASALAAVELFDLETNEWRDGPPLIQGRGYAAAVVYNNVIYVFGGKPCLGEPKALTTAEKFDPAIGRWQPIAQPPSARSAHRAVVMDGKIVLLGGQISPDSKTAIAVNNAEEYDPLTDRWRDAGWRLPNPAANFAIHYDKVSKTLSIAGGWPIARSNSSYRRDSGAVWHSIGHLAHANYEAAFWGGAT